MLYCPKCKNEYQEGYTHCSDCDCDLVPYEELYPKVPLYFGTEEEMNIIVSFFEANRLTSAEVRASKEDDTFEIIVSEEEEDKAKRYLHVYLSDKNQSEVDSKLRKIRGEENEFLSDLDDVIDDDLEEDLKQELSDLAAMEQMYEPAKIHENSTEKGKEYRSTGAMLIVVGLIGLVIVALTFTDHFIIHFSGTNKYMSCTVMSLFFLAFVGFGISSLKSGTQLLEKGDEEELLQVKIKEWAMKELTKEKIDGDEDFDAMDDSIAYFKRTEKMKAMILEEFQVDEGLLEELIEQYYEEIFG